jgi:hypothetical protein
MMDLQISRHALRTKPAFVNRKIVAWLEANHMVPFDEQVHSALNGAIGTMRRHYTINNTVRTPTAVGRVMKMWPIRFDDLFQVLNFTHCVSEGFRDP